MKLAPNEINECQKLISELESTGWEIVGAYWVHYAQADVPPEKQRKLNITIAGLNDRMKGHYLISLDSAIKRAKLKKINGHEIRLSKDDEFHSGIFHLEEKKEGIILTNVYFKNTFLKELYIFKCSESECTKKYPPRKKITTFKYFKELRFKEDFLSGKIWTGTLSGFRKIENANQGDKDEGLSFYNTTQSFSIEQWMEFAQKNPEMGRLINFNGFPGSEILISNLTVVSPDAYTICLSKIRDDELFRNDFGQYCVKINDTEKLFYTIIMAAMEKNPNIKHYRHGNVEYTKKPLRDLSEKLYSLFHKPERYSWQQEYRFSWVGNQTQEISPFLLDTCNFFSKSIIEDLI